jgi:hypothetical protein
VATPQEIKLKTLPQHMFRFYKHFWSQEDGRCGADIIYYYKNDKQEIDFTEPEWMPFDDRLDRGAVLKICADGNEAEMKRAGLELQFWYEQYANRPDNQVVVELIRFYEHVITKFEDWYRAWGLPARNVLIKRPGDEVPPGPDLNDAERDKDRIIELQNTNIVRLRNKLKYMKLPPQAELMEIADKSRKKNGSLNYTKIADQLGCSNHTAKKWCDMNRIT